MLRCTAGHCGSGICCSSDSAGDPAACDGVARHADGSDGVTEPVLRQLGLLHGADRHVQPHVAFLPGSLSLLQEIPPSQEEEEEEEEKKEEGSYLRAPTGQVVFLANMQ